MATISQRLSIRAMKPPGGNDADQPGDSDEIWGDEADLDAADSIAEENANRRRRNFTVLAFLLILVTGFTIGALVTQQRYKAQEVILSINGQILKEDAFVHRLEVTKGSETLQRMADEMLQDQYARKLGIVVPQSEIDGRYKQLISRPNFMQYLADNHQETADFMNQLRMEMIVNKIVEREVKVTEDDIARYYKEQTDHNNPHARFYTPPIVTISVIASTNKKRVIKAKQELDKGTDFNAIAAIYSDDLTSKQHGGELPPITRGRTLSSNIPGLDKVIFDMKVGETIGPMPFGAVWTIIHCLKQEPEVILSREQVDYECRVGALMAKLPKSTAAKIRSDYKRFQQSATIHMLQPKYQVEFGDK